MTFGTRTSEVRYVHLSGSPTDNLYKFAATCGTILAFICLVASFYVEQDDAEFRLRHTKDVENRMREQIRWITETVQKDGIKDDAKRERTLASVGKSIEEIYTQEITNLNSDIATRRIRIDKELRWLNFGMVAGAIVSIGGFSLWWRRVQRYQDLILVEELRKALADKTGPIPSA